MNNDPRHQRHYTGSSAELLVAYRFVECGRRPAWPLVVSPYDLLVDIGDRVVKVQVKQASTSDKINRWQVRFKRRAGEVVYSVTAFDYLAVVIDPGKIYVIPVGALACAHAPGRLVARVEIGPQNERFASYLNNFALGPGPAALAQPVVAAKRSMWFTREQVAGGRKPHHRVSSEEVIEMRRLAGLQQMSISQIAAQFKVTYPTAKAAIFGTGRFKASNF